MPRRFRRALLLRFLLTLLVSIFCHLNYLLSRFREHFEPGTTRSSNLIRFVSTFKKSSQPCQLGARGSKLAVIYPMSFRTSCRPAPCDRHALRGRYAPVRRSDTPTAHSRSKSGSLARRFHLEYCAADSDERAS